MSMVESDLKIVSNY